MNTVRDLEDLIIDVIYAGLLGAKMHHHEKVLHVDWVIGRDLRAADLVDVRNKLMNWSVLCREVFRKDRSRIAYVHMGSGAILLNPSSAL